MLLVLILKYIFFSISDIIYICIFETAIETADEDCMKNRKFIKVIAQFAKPYTVLFIIAEICIVVSYTVAVLLPLNLTRLIDEVFYAENYMILKDIIMAYLGLFLISVIFNLIYSFTWQTLNNRYIVDIKTKMYESIMRSKASTLSNMNSGDIMSRIDSDADQFIHIIQRNIFHFINSIIMCLGIVLIVAKINVIIAVMLVLAAVLPIIITKIAGNFLEKYMRRIRELNGDFTGKLFEILKGFREIILLRAGWWTNKVIFRNLKESIVNENKAKKTDFLVNKFIYLINVLTSIIIYAFTIYLVYNDVLTVGFFIAIIEYIALLHKKINWILRIYLDWHGRKVSIDRVCEILDYETEQLDGDRENISLDIDGIESIEFVNAGFSYSTNRLEDMRNIVLNDTSFKIEKGEKLGIAGISGVGKTTIVGLILKYYDLQEGYILINGMDISNVNRFDIRKNIGIVQQEITLFNGSLRANLLLGNEENISDEKIMDICNKTGLTELINSFPNGLDTVINSQFNLSGGQKQRIMIVRILLRNVKVIILDEATSALDEDTEMSIMNEIERLCPDLMLIIISHRLSTIRRCDRIIVLNEGHVEKSGKHECLIKESLTYRQMFAESEAL